MTMEIEMVANKCPGCGIMIHSPESLNVKICSECTEIATGILHNWYVLPGSSRIHGVIFQDVLGRFRDGEEVITTPVMVSDNGIVVTKSGSIYRLGYPHRSVLNLK